MREGYCSRFVCVYVCRRSSASVRRVCNKLNLPIPARSSLNNKGFQLTDFAKKLFFLSSSSFFTFARPKRPSSFTEVASSIGDHYLRALIVGKWSSTWKALILYNVHIIGKWSSGAYVYNLYAWLIHAFCTLVLSLCTAAPCAKG